MLVVKIWGGLGNQLFQYAYAYSYAKKNNIEDIYFDIDFHSLKKLFSTIPLPNGIISYSLWMKWEDNCIVLTLS